LPLVCQTLSWFLLEMFVVSIVCLVFSNFVEKRLTDVDRRMQLPVDPLVMILAASLLVASAAECRGLSTVTGFVLPESCSAAIQKTRVSDG
jgi:hypothetical protein